MPKETDRLKLPLPLGNESVTRESINEIFEKIDAGVATREDLDMLREAVSQMDIPDASLTQKGKVQLSNKTDGTSETVAATEKAVGEVMLVAQSTKSTSSNRNGYGTTTNSGNTYSVNLTPAPAAYVDGLRITIKINVANTGTVTINVNGLGTKSVLKSNGSNMTANALRANSVYSLVYNGTAFILQGEGGAGNALPSDVVLGKTFTNENGEAVGTRISYIAGEIMSYTKMGFDSYPIKSHYVETNLTSSGSRVKGMCLAKDGSGYYVLIQDNIEVWVCKYNNFGLFLWKTSIRYNSADFYLGIPVAGTRDGGIAVYMNDQSLSRNVLIKVSPNGTIEKKLSVSFSGDTSSAPMGIAIDSIGNIFISETGFVRKVAMKDDFSISTSFVNMHWNTSVTGSSALVVDDNYLYYINDNRTVMNVSKDSGAGSGRNPNLLTNEVLVPASLTMDSNFRMYVGTTGRRVIWFAQSLSFQAVDTDPSAGYNYPIYNITNGVSENEFNVLGRPNGSNGAGLSSSIKTFSSSNGKMLAEFIVSVPVQRHLGEIDPSPNFIGRLLHLTPSPSSNFVVGLTQTNNVFMRNLLIQS